jgi:hypothetical protein
MTDSLREILQGRVDILQKLKILFTDIEEGEEKIDSASWRQCANFFYEEKNSDGLAWFSLLSIMLSLQLPHLHIANQQSISLYCKLFMRGHINLDANEEKIYTDIVENRPLNCTAVGLAEYLQQMTALIKESQELGSAFAEGIITAMPRERAKQLVEIVQCITEKPIICVRLSSSFPNEIALTQFAYNTIFHRLFSIEAYKKMSENKEFSDAHRIMPRCDFDPVEIIKKQAKQYTCALRYTNKIFSSKSFTEGEVEKTPKQSMRQESIAKAMRVEEPTIGVR